MNGDKLARPAAAAARAASVGSRQRRELARPDAVGGHDRAMSALHFSCHVGSVLGRYSTGRV